MSIARSHFGDAGAYRAILDANGSGASGVLEPGTRLSIPCPTAAVTPGWRVLLDIEGLDALDQSRTGLQIVDIRAPAGAADGFVPGAIRLPFEDWRTAALQGPDAPRLARILGRAGLDPARPVVIVAEDGGAESIDRAAWVYWLLKTVGSDEVAILAPGFEGWRAAGNRPSRRPDRRTSRPIALSLDLSWTAGQDEIAAIIEGRRPGMLLEGGPEALPADAEPGSDWQLWAQDVLDDLKRRPVDWESGPVVTLAGGGLSGAAAWFFASEVAGIRDVRLAMSGG